MEKLKHLIFKGICVGSGKEYVGTLVMLDRSAIDSKPKKEIGIKSGECTFVCSESSIELVDEGAFLKAAKWDKLNEKIAPYYNEDDERYNNDMGLVSIGEIAASAFGYL